MGDVVLAAFDDEQEFEEFLDARNASLLVGQAAGTHDPREHVSGSFTSLGIERDPGTNVSFVGLLPMECGLLDGTRETLQTAFPLCQRGRSGAPTRSQP